MKHHPGSLVLSMMELQLLWLGSRRDIPALRSMLPLNLALAIWRFPSA